jgi:hypothetical protein
MTLDNRITLIVHCVEYVQRNGPRFERATIKRQYKKGAAFLRTLALPTTSLDATECTERSFLTVLRTVISVRNILRHDCAKGTYACAETTSRQHRFRVGRSKTDW